MNVFNVDDSVPNIVPSPVTSACICALLFCNNYWLLLMPCILFIDFKTGCAKLYGTSINKNKMMHLVCNVNLLPCSFIHSTLIRIETLKELLQNKKRAKQDQAADRSSRGRGRGTTCTAAATSVSRNKNDGEERTGAGRRRGEQLGTCEVGRGTNCAAAAGSAPPQKK